MNKSYTLTVTQDTNGLDVRGVNHGFNILELIGIVEIKRYDLMKQLTEQDAFIHNKRTAVLSTGEVVNIDDKDDGTNGHITERT